MIAQKTTLVKLELWRGVDHSMTATCQAGADTVRLAVSPMVAAGKGMEGDGATHCWALRISAGVR